jgi:hypothetical protein
VASLWTPGGGEPARDELPPPDLNPDEQAELAAELAAMQEQLATTPAAVVVANHAVGLFQLAAIHLNRRPPNLAEGQLAIDAMAALVEGLAGRLGEEETSLREALSQVRLAYVALTGGPAAPPQPE